MKLLVLLAIATVCVFSDQVNDDHLRNGPQHGHGHFTFFRHMQCRQCVAPMPSHTNPNHPFQQHKWCATSKDNDYAGTCIRASETCPANTVVMSVQADCPNDAPETKKSCSLCMLDGYEWCRALKADVLDEYDGECMIKDSTPVPPVPPHGEDPVPPVNPNHPDQPHDTPAPAPGDSTSPSNPSTPTPGPVAPVSPNKCKTGLYPTAQFMNCPVVILTQMATAPDRTQDGCMKPLPGHSHGHGPNPAAFIVPIVLCTACLCFCIKRRMRRRRAEREAQIAAMQVGGSPVQLPVAQPVGYELPQQSMMPIQATTVQYQPVIHTGQPVRYGPLISAPTSFLPREDIGVEMQGRSNGYSQVSQAEP